MASRTAAAIRRLPPHAYQENKDAPGTCVHCRLIKRNDVHLKEHDPRLVELTQAQEEHRRRIGDEL